MTIKRVGVVGMGTMGKGVSQLLATHGIEVLAIDSDDEVLKNVKDEIFQELRMTSFINPNYRGIDIDKALEKITFFNSLDYLDDVDFVVENVTEDIAKKKEVYERLNKVCKSDTILAANTSCISITKISSYVQNPQRIIGIHFMNPVTMIEGVEVMKGVKTSEDTIKLVDEWLTSLGKTPIFVNDSPGFVSNRISHLMMNEAAFLVQEGVAEVEDIDKIFKLCYGHKMGPLETADLIGIDTVVDSLDVLFDSYKDPKFRCCTLLRKMVDADERGRKTGKGFYDYAN